jgi:hypothetical protein
MAAYLTNPAPWAAGASVHCPALSLTNGTVKKQPIEDWKAEDEPVLVDWGGGNVIFVSAYQLVAGAS